MKDFINNLFELNIELERGSLSINEIIDKLELYINKYFIDDNARIFYQNKLNIHKQSFLIKPKDFAKNDLRNFVNILIEDLQMNENDLSIFTENEKNKILSQLRKETEIERRNIEIQAREINEIKEELEKERKRLEKDSQIEKNKLNQELHHLEQERLRVLEESKKFDDFRKKLEVADKQIDFKIISQNNNNSSIFWAICAFALIIILFICLLCSIDKYTVFSDISISIKNKFIKEKNFDPTIIKSATYFGFAKYITATILLYSFVIYCIVFCIKNYNSQMHNKIINQHKSNALNSILSLLDTAKSDEGNDKLLIQATQAIFSHQNTGYNNNDTETQNPNLVTNIVESVSKKI